LVENTTIPIPRIDWSQFLSIKNFMDFWSQWIPIRFEYLLGVLLLASVYLRSRDPITTGVTALVMAAVWPLGGGLFALVASLGVALIVYQLYKGER